MIDVCPYFANFWSDCGRWQSFAATARKRAREIGRTWAPARLSMLAALALAFAFTLSRCRRRSVYCLTIWHSRALSTISPFVYISYLVCAASLHKWGNDGKQRSALSAAEEWRVQGAGGGVCTANSSHTGRCWALAHVWACMFVWKWCVCACFLAAHSLSLSTLRSDKLGLGSLLGVKS